MLQSLPGARRKPPTGSSTPLAATSPSALPTATPPTPNPTRPAPTLGRVLLGVVASVAAGAAGTLAPAAPGAYAAEAVSRPAPPMPSPAAGPGDRLTVTVRKAGGGADGTFELRCHPEGGTHPDVREACGRLDRRTTWGTDPFAPVRSGTVCTMQYGGPATAHVTGTWAGRRVDARFDRGDGCEIARWDDMVPVLPDLRA
ncbi:SSI family serine proteinase inhibitor [Streptomyces sp. 11x1]|uniref:SSI family serine proteinase inhibitor n=1 Tax=Streptomyces sp. 11x1 TaxID=3038642 RepID=UPI00292CB3DF|nr:SSI family serine proteinase inhibitor [Streptomyces sp. 11x1]WNZ10308.1 SSI family serine proteinase inhibitor [Streptomyces sp. 11x1]